MSRGAGEITTWVIWSIVAAFGLFGLLMYRADTREKNECIAVCGASGLRGIVGHPTSGERACICMSGVVLGKP
jgi:hypothetical protein